MPTTITPRGAGVDFCSNLQRELEEQSHIHPRGKSSRHTAHSPDIAMLLGKAWMHRAPPEPRPLAIVRRSLFSSTSLFAVILAHGVILFSLRRFGLSSYVGHWHSLPSPHEHRAHDTISTLRAQR